MRRAGSVLFLLQTESESRNSQPLAQSPLKSSPPDSLTGAWHLLGPALRGDVALRARGSGWAPEIGFPPRAELRILSPLRLPRPQNTRTAARSGRQGRWRGKAAPVPEPRAARRRAALTAASTAVASTWRGRLRTPPPTPTPLGAHHCGSGAAPVGRGRGAGETLRSPRAGVAASTVTPLAAPCAARRRRF